ncbi:MAG: RagB/SusD family nutrient uptake outer membrane protein, partial [Rikenellaceae bacterium]|nr:RagB/SusD family nutrient uptake outer membrane protein [Rikenellaceae bacterium]
MLINDFIGNDIVEPRNYGYNGVYQLEQTTLTSSYHNWRVWFNAYYVINNMNEIIAKIDGVPVQPGEEGLVNQLKGQAYALRGWMYHSLIVFFNFSYKYDPQAKGIPIYTEPVTADTESPARSSVAEVYSRVQEDLEEAYNLLSGYTRDQKYRIDRSVVAGLLARHHLSMENWKEAQEYAAAAHQNYEYMSTAQYHEGFNELASNPECMIGHANTADQASATSYSFHYRDTHNSISYYYSMMADPYFKDNFFDLEDGDTRNDLFEWSIDRAAGYLMYKKFSFRVSEGRIADVIVMRKSEMVLIEAEG